MLPFPEYIGPEKMRAACELLGLPADLVASVHMDARTGVSVTVHVRDAKGRILLAGSETLTATLCIDMPPTATGSDAFTRVWLNEVTPSRAPAQAAP